MKKKFILDTNIFLSDPNSLFSFEDNDVYIPISAIEELDHFKKLMTETGRNAREVSRILDDLRQKGPLNQGIPLTKAYQSLYKNSSEHPTLHKDLGFLYVSLDSGMDLLPKYFERKTDHLILNFALSLQKEFPKFPVILITKDSNLRIKADALNIKVADFETNKVNIEELYTGISEQEVEGSIIEKFLQDRELFLDSSDLRPNQFVILKDRDEPTQFIYGRYDAKSQCLRSLNYSKKSSSKSSTWGLYPRNLEQSFALDLLLDDSIKLITLVGSAGTGKTLLAIAAGLEKTTDENKYQKLLVSRPVFPLGKDIGYLPGTMEEKLNPWMKPIFDNLELLMGTQNSRTKKLAIGYQDLMEQKILEVEPLTYIRGRSIPNQYFIVDEAQNLTPHEIKTILTRVGENTKIVLTGDPYQIDNPYVDASSNGLTYVIERLSQESISGHMTLTRGERSELATISAKLL